MDARASACPDTLTLINTERANANACSNGSNNCHNDPHIMSGETLTHAGVP